MSTFNGSAQHSRAVRESEEAMKNIRQRVTSAPSVRSTAEMSPPFRPTLSFFFEHCLNPFSTLNNSQWAPENINENMTKLPGKSTANGSIIPVKQQPDVNLNVMPNINENFNMLSKTSRAQDSGNSKPANGSKIPVKQQPNVNLNVMPNIKDENFNILSTTPQAPNPVEFDPEGFDEDFQSEYFSRVGESTIVAVEKFLEDEISDALQSSITSANTSCNTPGKPKYMLIADPEGKDSAVLQRIVTTDVTRNPMTESRYPTYINLTNSIIGQAEDFKGTGMGFHRHENQVTRNPMAYHDSRYPTYITLTNSIIDEAEDFRGTGLGFLRHENQVTPHYEVMSIASHEEDRDWIIPSIVQLDDGFEYDLVEGDWVRM